MSTQPAGHEPATTDVTTDADVVDEAPTADTSMTETAPDETAADEQAKPKRGRPKGSGARKTRTVQLTLTVTGTAEGEWQAELKHGSTWVTRGVSVPASAVSRAAKELHEDISNGIDDVIDTAREEQRKKLGELEAEMARVKQALAELEE